MRAYLRTWLVAVAALVASVGVASAQTGTIKGRVTDSTRSQPLSGAQVSVRDASGRQVGSAVSASGGDYSVSVPAGTYRVLVSLIPFAPKSYEGVTVTAGGTTTVDVLLISSTYQMSEMVVTAVSRVPEKLTEAPAEITVIPAVKIQERPSLTVTDQLAEVPGVQISQGGLVQANVVGRGFNNIFSGALLTMIDNRYASVPSLRVNVPAFFPTTNEDIERIEFVLGPGAALYGPNAADGVLAITTKSPITSPGNTIAFEAGARSSSPSRPAGAPSDAAGLYRLSFRSATAFSPKVGFKISGEYLKGTDWRYADAADTLSPGTTANSRTACSLSSHPFGCRNFNLEKWSGEARLDVKPNENTEWITSYGRSQAVSLIELTGIGAGQAKDWVYQDIQTRFRYKELFAQAFVNFSNAGQTFLLRSGNPIVDRSRLWAGQIQHGFSIGANETIIYGADYLFTQPVTDGTVNGSNEADDNIKEVGGYVHSVTHVSPKVDVVAALRADKHNRLDKAVFSPRVAFVFKPNDENNFRVTYNRAFSTPTSNNLSLDILAGSVPLGGGLSYGIRALGVPQGGFHFRASGGCTGGVSNLCMRSPFDPSNTLLPASANLLWSAAVAAVLPTLQQINPQLAGALQAIPTPSAAQVGTTLRTLNPTTASFTEINPDNVTDIQTLKPSITNTVELGYKLAKGRKASFSVSGYYEHRENFIGPLIVETPNVFLDPTSLASYLGAALAQVGVPAAQIPAAVQAIAGGMAKVPLATVVPNQAGTGGSRDALVNDSDLFLTYRNFGTVDLFGADLALDYAFNDRFSFSGTYSWVNKDLFTAADVGGPTDIALNASKSHGSAAFRYRNDVAGWGAEVRVRAVKGFPVNSGVYVSESKNGILQPTDSYGVLDLQASWRPPVGVRNMLISATMTNVLNHAYATFVGVPKLGRLLLTKVSYTF